jgi:hypothetical protein
MSLGVAGIEYRPTSNLVASTRRQALVLMGRLAVVLFSSQPTLYYDGPTVHPSGQLVYHCLCMLYPGPTVHTLWTAWQFKLVRTGRPEYRPIASRLMRARACILVLAYGELMEKQRACPQLMQLRCFAGSAAAVRTASMRAFRIATG